MSSHSMNTHMHFRISMKNKKTIEAAARLKGLRPNTYARQRLLEIAEKDIIEMNQLNTLTLSDKDWEKFVEIMEAPIQINDNLKNAILEYNKITEN